MMTNDDIKEAASKLAQQIAIAARDFSDDIAKAAREGYIGDLWRTDYEVEGAGEFPVDMLRYACSYPAREEDAHAIAREGNRVVRLSRTHRDRSPTLPMARFESMHWRVIRVVDTVRV